MAVGAAVDGAVVAGEEAAGAKEVAVHGVVVEVLGVAATTKGAAREPTVMGKWPWAAARANGERPYVEDAL